MTPLRYSNDKDQILEKLRLENIRYLYHWTSIENISSISIMKALCSKQTLESAGLWPPPVPGGNDLSHGLDRARGNWDKVSLNFSPYTPMVYHKKREYHMCFLLLNLDVATWQGVVFTDANATCNDQRRDTGINGLNLVNFNAIRMEPRPWDKTGWHRPVQAEVLVPGQIPLDFVERVLFISDASLKEGERLWGQRIHPPFVISKRPFADGPQNGAPIGFAYLEDLILSDQTINSKNVWNHYQHQDLFIKGVQENITMIAKVNAKAGTKARSLWNPGNLVGETEFETTTQYAHFPSMKTIDLPSGNCYVEYFIDEVRWSRTPFVIETV